jgi:D-glycero-D-manno-heptose 1,7-bisphosphate phosphatase
MPSNRHHSSETTSPDRPTQAVILAGGRGTRLAPLTNTRPKPMIPFHGKPFLEHLIEMVRDQGFSHVLLLLGYLPDVIRDYFGDGGNWGVSITYSISDVDDETGRRLKRAAPLIDPISLLLYCDNYWPMPFPAMWRQFSRTNAAAQITVYRNGDRYTKDNLRVDDKGFVVAYDKSRTMPGLAGVDIGFVLLKRSVVESLPDENVSFERVVYQDLLAKRQLGGFVTNHRYYSVGSHERLPLTEAFLARHPTVLLDRDGVLNKRMPRARYVCSWSEWEWLPGSQQALCLLTEAGYRILVITNQPGIARGALTNDTLESIHQGMKQDVRRAGGEITAIYHCPHNWDEGCDCRKPRPGMLFQAQRDFHLDLTGTYFIGDDERDAQAAQAAGCPWTLVTQERSLLDVTRDLLAGNLPREPMDLTPPGLREAA